MPQTEEKAHMLAPRFGARALPPPGVNGLRAPLLRRR
jgi:hypothetical protein